MMTAVLVTIGIVAAVVLSRLFQTPSRRGAHRHAQGSGDFHTYGSGVPWMDTGSGSASDSGPVDPGCDAGTDAGGGGDAGCGDGGGGGGED